MKRAHSAGVFGAATLAATIAVFLLFNARFIDPDDHNRVIGNLSKLQELDSQLNEIVLKLRDSLMNNYDPLVETLNLIKAHERDLQQGSKWMAQLGGAELGAAMEVVRRKLAEKEALIEEFKSRNAILKNSYHYLPRLVETIVSDSQSSVRMRTRAQAVLQNILLLRMGFAPADYESLDRQLGELRSELETEPVAVRANADLVVRHAQNVLEHQAKLDALVEKATLTAARHPSQSLAEAYNRAFQSGLKQANLYRFTLLLFSLTLLAYAAWSFVRLRQNASELRIAALALENAGEGVVIYDERRIIISVNKAFVRITGYSAEEVTQCASEFLHLDEHDTAFHEQLWTDVRQTGNWHGELSARRKNGATYPEWRNISAVKDSDGQITHFVSVFSDISRDKQAKAQLEFLAHHDALTGLPNRVLFMDRVQEAINRAHRRKNGMAILFIDLDRFKNVNDSLGHEMGDQLLQQATARLKKCVRDTDTVSRLGGDEFTILVEELAQLQQATLVAKKVLASLSEPFVLGAHEVFISASIGISCYPQDGADPPALLKSADAAMYRAKKQGRNTFRHVALEIEEGKRPPDTVLTRSASASF